MSSAPLSAVPDESPDPFDPSALRVDEVADIETERVLTTVPVRKPNRNEFFRVHPREEFCLPQTLVIEHVSGMDRHTYLVQGDARLAIADELRLVRIFTAISKAGTVFLWPAKLPRPDRDAGRRWAETALHVAEQAKFNWVKMVGNRDLGAYDLFRARGDLGDPQWPADKSFQDLLRLAFQEFVITSADHPVIKELNGEV
jgi:hypothetical protein